MGSTCAVAAGSGGMDVLRCRAVAPRTDAVDLRGRITEKESAPERAAETARSWGAGPLNLSQVLPGRPVEGSGAMKQPVE